jgi:GT2 family glycosyltransferase
MVTHDPGPWFDVTLRALAAQDHPRLRVLVLDTGDTDPTARVHAVLPEAIVRRMGRATGFGAAANDVLELAPEADHYLFCHDDVAPEPGAVSTMVAVATAWAAGVVGPKLVRWDDPRRLLQVGEAVDKTGATMSMVDRGDLDQGQHDGLREVFSVPGAFTLVNADLFARVGGFDELVSFCSDNLSLCWRARLAGARVVVTTDVRVRHREQLRDRVSPRRRRRLGARHRLRVMLTCYGRVHLLRVVPQAALASLLEVVTSLLTGRLAAAGAVGGAWWWNLRHVRSLWAARRQVRRFRRVRDKEVRALQVPGLLRPQLVVLRMAHRADRRRTPAVSLSVSGGGERSRRDRRIAAAAVATAGGGPGSGRSNGSDGVNDGERVPAGWTSGAVIVLLLLAGALALGSRHLVTRGVPVVGDLVAIDAPNVLFDQWTSGWRSAGLGSESAAPTALGALAGLGALFDGHTELLRLVLTAGMIPLGVLGALRLLRPAGSRRGSVAVALAYALLPLPYGALAHGRWAPLAVYGAAPWLLAVLARAGGLAPLGSRVVSEAEPWVTPRGRAGGHDLVHAGASGARVGASKLGLVLGLGLLTALLTLLVPAAPLVVLIVALALAVGSLLAFEPRGIVRTVGVGLGGAVVAFYLHLPWSWEVLHSWQATGLWSGVYRPAGGVDPLDVLRLGVGVSQAGPMVWALLPAAAVALLVGRGWRLSLAIRGWVLALTGWGMAWASWHGALGLPWPHPDVLLVIGGLGLALAIGLGVSAVELDVLGRGRRLGLRRQIVAVGAVSLAAALGPLAVGALDGYWNMPRGDYSRVLSFVDEGAVTLAPRVLWVGDPDILPVPSWSLADVGTAVGGGAALGGTQRSDTVEGLAFGTSTGLPAVHDMWPSPPDEGIDRIGEAVDLAIDQQTTRLGRLLAPLAVQYVVVPQSLAPAPYTDVEQPATPELLSALAGQLDLERVDVDSGLWIYRNTAFVPGRAVVDDIHEAPATAEAGDLRRLDLAAGARPALHDRGHDLATGQLPDHTTLLLSAPDSPRWVLEVDGRQVERRPSFGWATAFRVIDGGRAALAYETPPARRVALIVQGGLWLLVVGVAATGRMRRRRHRRVSHRRWRSQSADRDLDIDDLDDVDERVTIIAPTDRAPEPLDAEAFPALLAGTTDTIPTLADLAPDPLPDHEPDHEPDCQPDRRPAEVWS